jgi:hypothetical protein
MLISARGQSLPAVVSENTSTGSRQEVTGGYVDLRADGTAKWSTSYRYTDPTVPTGFPSTWATTSEGEFRYVVSGNTMTVTSGDGLGGVLTGDNLTIRADVELVYRRQ